MEKLIRNNNSYRHEMSIDGLEIAKTKQQKWWRAHLVVMDGDRTIGLIKKDTFWKWNLTYIKDDENVLFVKTKWFSGIQLLNPDGRRWNLKRKGGDNQLVLLDSEGNEVLLLEKQGKWWKSRPYKVIHEEVTQLPMSDENFPILVVGILGVLNQRMMLIFGIAMMIQGLAQIFNVWK